MHKMDVRKTGFQKAPHGSVSERRPSGVVDLCQAECLFDLGTTSMDLSWKFYFIARTCAA